MHAPDPQPLLGWNNASQSGDLGHAHSWATEIDALTAAPAAPAEVTAAAAEAAGRSFMASASRAFYGDPTRFQALLVLTAALDRLQEEFGPQIAFDQPNDMLMAAAAAYDDVRARATVLFADHPKLLRSFQQFLPPQTLPLRRPSPAPPPQPTTTTFMSNQFPAARSAAAAAATDSSALPTQRNESRGRPQSRNNHDSGNGGGDRGRGSSSSGGGGLVMTVLSGSRGSSPAPPQVMHRMSSPSTVPPNSFGSGGNRRRPSRSSSPSMMLRVQNHREESDIRNGDTFGVSNAVKSSAMSSNTNSRFPSPDHSPTRSVATSHPGSRPGSPGANSIVAGYPPGLWRPATLSGGTGGTGIVNAPGSALNGIGGVTDKATSGGGGALHIPTSAAAEATTTTTKAPPPASQERNHQSRRHYRTSPGGTRPSVHRSPSPSLTSLALEAAQQQQQQGYHATSHPQPPSSLGRATPPSRHPRDSRSSPSTPLVVAPAAPAVVVPTVHLPVARSPLNSQRVGIGGAVLRRVPLSPSPVPPPTVKTYFAPNHSAGSTGATTATERLPERGSAFESYQQQQQQPPAHKQSAGAPGVAAEWLNVSTTMLKSRSGGGGGGTTIDDQRAAVLADLEEAEALLAQSLEAPSNLQSTPSAAKNLPSKNERTNPILQPPPPHHNERQPRKEPLSLLELAEVNDDENSWRKTPPPPQLPPSSSRAKSNSMKGSKDASPASTTPVAATSQPPKAEIPSQNTTTSSSWSVQFDVLLLDLNLATFDAPACKTFVAAATEAFGIGCTGGPRMNDDTRDYSRCGRVELLSVQAGSITVGARLRGLPNAERARAAAARASRSIHHGDGNGSNNRESSRENAVARRDAPSEEASPKLVAAMQRAGLGRARLSKMEVVAEEEEREDDGSVGRARDRDGDDQRGPKTPVGAAQASSQHAPQTAAFAINSPVVTPLSSAFVVQRLTPSSAIVPPTPNQPRHQHSLNSSCRGDTGGKVDIGSIRSGNLDEELERLGFPVEASAAAPGTSVGADFTVGAAAVGNGSGLVKEGGQASSKDKDSSSTTSSAAPDSSSRGNRFARAAEAMPLTAKKPPRAPPALSREGIESVERRRRMSLLAVNGSLDKANTGGDGGDGATDTSAGADVTSGATVSNTTAGASNTASGLPRSSSPLIERILEASADASAAAGTAAAVAAEKPLWEEQRAQYVRRTGLREDLDLSSIAGSLNSGDV